MDYLNVLIWRRHPSFLESVLAISDAPRLKCSIKTIHQDNQMYRQGSKNKNDKCVVLN